MRQKQRSKYSTWLAQVIPPVGVEGSGAGPQAFAESERPVRKT